MRGRTICDVWAIIPGLSDYWCYQIEWRIGIDEEVIAALSEPRYPAPLPLSDDNDNDADDDDDDIIILVQTIYLCQLFLHLQEFDPGVGPEQPDGEEELVRVFQDTLAREFNNSHPHPRDDTSPAPDGETLERVVRGLMKAQRDDPSSLPPTGAAATTTDRRSGLQRLLVQILVELNRPLFDKARRYEQAFGPRTDETWAARFATRVMQWRWSMRPPSGLTEEVIRVFPHDVHPLDEEGLEVYRIVRNAAPGHIHLVSPLQPEVQQPLVSSSRGTGNNQHGYQRSVSSGGFKRQQHILGSPLLSQGSPRTPLLSQQQPPPQTIQAESSIKRGSPRDAHLPASKRPRSMVALADDDNTYQAVAAAAAAEGADIPIRSAPAGDEADQEAQVTNHLLWRVLDGINSLGRQIDSMQQDLGRRFSRLDDRLKHIEEWISDEV